MDATTGTGNFLGYICEARQMGSVDGELCHFPFIYGGNTYSSCTYTSVPSINPNGEAWCATQVHISKD